LEGNDLSNQSVVLTPDGKRKLEEELNDLKVVQRAKVAADIKTALSFGDLSENAEYDEAKNAQARVEGRIRVLEEMLRKAVIVDDSDRPRAWWAWAPKSGCWTWSTTRRTPTPSSAPRRRTRPGSSYPPSPPSAAR
jgi:hypothetical protein